MIFTSDNAGGVAPEILQAVAAAAAGSAMPYGADPVTGRVEAQLREIFEAPEAAVYLVATGTAANSLALACLCPPWATVYAHDQSHIERDECAAPEFFTGGAKITLIDGEAARMRADTLAEQARLHSGRFVHGVQNGAVSITQATEHGATYTREEIATLAGIAHEHGMGVHMDGTRFANALVRSNCTPAEMTWKAGIDILCLGATKNGAMAAEAVILFDPAKAWEFELRRKRGGHLFSKMRFVSAQMEAYLSDGLWLRLADRANTMADRLAAGIATVPDARLLTTHAANMLFVEMTLAQHRRLQAAGARYYPWPGGQDEEAGDDAPFRARLVCSHQTTEADVDRFIEVLADA